MSLPEKGTERIPTGRLPMVDNGISPAGGEVLLVTRDSLVTSRLRAACVSRGLRVVESEPELSSPPRLVAVDLADPAALLSLIHI